MMKENKVSGLLVAPTKLFFCAQAFWFSSGRGQCFSPGVKSLFIWHAARLKRVVFDRSAAKWWRVWFEKV